MTSTHLLKNPLTQSFLSVPHNMPWCVSFLILFILFSMCFLYLDNHFLTVFGIFLSHFIKNILCLFMLYFSFFYAIIWKLELFLVSQNSPHVIVTLLIHDWPLLNNIISLPFLHSLNSLFTIWSTSLIGSFIGNFIWLY